MKNFFLILLVASLIACAEDKKKPEGILSQEQMVALMIDINIAEAKVGNRRVNPDSSKILFRNYELDLFNKYNIDDSTYMRSYKYYMQDLDAMAEISAAVVDSLSLRERLHASEKPKDKKKAN